MNDRTVRVNATLHEDLLRRVDAFAASRYEDRSTALRQLIDFALRELTQREAVDAYKAGRLTLRELARALGLQIWPTHDLLASQGVAVAQGARTETRSSLEELIDSIEGGT
jgi:hypothetical protein